jgi:hypothetical protein
MKVPAFGKAQREEEFRSSRSSGVQNPAKKRSTAVNVNGEPKDER